ncbi:hypothetical protein Hanom_Chr07g00591501 [Helianthus anomalus]
MALPYKTPHNYLFILEKPSDNTTFHSVIDALSSSRYKTLLTCNPSIYLGTLRDFWKNAQLEVQDKKPWAITSSVKGIKVAVIPKDISEVFELNDITGKTSFPKTDYQTDFLERGYAEEMKNDTLQKGSFPPATRFLFHTLLMCVSNKTTTFNEIPLKSNIWDMLFCKMKLLITPKRFLMTWSKMLIISKTRKNHFFYFQGF